MWGRRATKWANHAPNLHLLLLCHSDIGTQQEKNDTTAKALDMSLRYSFVTHVTSMVVAKPESEDGPYSLLIADKLTEGKGDV